MITSKTQIRLHVIGRLIGLSFLIFHLSFSSVAAQTLGRYRAEFSLTAIDFIDTLSIEWEREQVFVPITIGGRSYRFLLDTGAGMSVVYSGTPLADSPHAGDIISHDATGRSDTVRMVALPALQLGSVALYGCRATVQQRGAARQPFDGILGFDLVNGGLSMKIDVARRQLVVTDRRRFFDREEGAVRMRYRLNYHVPYIDVMPFGHHREQMLFDTGSRQFLSINKRHFDEAMENGDTACCTVEGRSVGRHAIGHYGTEPEGEVTFLQLDRLRLGHCCFSDVHAITTQGGSHLGAPLLAYGAVAFSPASRRMLFYPAEQTTRCATVGNEQLDIAFVADPQGRAQVGLLWEQGTPYRQGFRQGDIIEQIDHRPVRGFAHFVNWGFEPGREYIFTVRSQQGERRDVHWVRLEQEH